VSKFKFGIGVAGSTLSAATGDWDGDGTVTPGYFNPADERWYQINDNAFGAAVSKFKFGIGVTPSNLVAVSGDWDADGETTTGYFDTTDDRWYQINENAFGAAVSKFKFGIGVSSAALTAVSGDWDGTTAP
jgi:hypothetical protein